jgi:hypothetical protein
MPAQPAARRAGPGDLDRYASTVPSYANSMPAEPPSADFTAPGSRVSWPLIREPLDDAATLPAPFPLVEPAAQVEVPRQREGRVMPPWQSDDLPAEPPALRLVEPAPLTDPALSTGPMSYRDELYEPPPLRLVEPDRSDRSARRTALDRPLAPVPDSGDNDLLIFAETSVWFTNVDEIDTELDWSNPSDIGWHAAEQAAQPSVGNDTLSGLPKRVPQQNLVPGSAISAPERPLRIVRDPEQIAAHTTGYFRGWRRGQEVGGFRVGGRPGRESTSGWDFSREQSDRDYEYRSSAGHR